MKKPGQAIVELCTGSRPQAQPGSGQAGGRRTAHEDADHCGRELRFKRFLTRLLLVLVYLYTLLVDLQV